MTIRELYLEFRQEVDKICVPEILKCVWRKPIMLEGKTVGLLCYTDNYIDCLYIKPEYRRRGLASGTILEWYKRQKGKEIRLHIIKKNKVALKFWTSLFELEPIEENEIDTLYRIKRVIE